ncbi:hypothetical protein WSM22_29510 [Cytophagales bacterium WSM2-2]|nr:hypothetical protein WSM22_29510 [Cytophagales bacterium WSM2-2]
MQSPPSFDLAAQYVKDTAAINSYIKSNAITTAKKLDHGVWYVIDSVGVGVRPAFSAAMRMTYKMKLLSDGSTIDQTSTPVTLGLANLIRGIRSSMPYFQNGCKGRIFIPSYFAYQNMANGPIPANANLIFEFKLIDVLDQALQADTVTIRNYLTTNAIKARKDASGMSYTIDNAGTGLTPTPDDSVSISYTSKFLSSGTVLDQQVNKKYRIADLVLCWQIALPIVSEGTKMTLYVPSSLEYIPFTTDDYPAYSNLIFNIELLKVYHH